MKTVQHGTKVTASRALLRCICERCLTAFETVWAKQKYCTSCQSAVKAEWAGVRGEAVKQSKTAALEDIHENLGSEALALSDSMTATEYEWLVMYKVPFKLEASKNSRWSLGRRGSGVYVTERVRSYSNEVTRRTREALNGINVAHNKLWISFLVEKENHKFDAINVVDTLADAIKEAVPIDDNWFCIGSLDWRIKKKEPEIFIRIGQCSTEDVLVCSHCGRILPLSEFGKKKNGPLGRSRSCKGCTSILGKHARAKSRELRGVSN